MGTRCSSRPARRGATQTLAGFLAGLGERVPQGVVVEPGLRSAVEDRWRAVYERRERALRALRENEPAAFGLAGQILDPIAKGAAVLVIEEDGAVCVEPLADDGASTDES